MLASKLNLFSRWLIIIPHTVFILFLYIAIKSTHTFTTDRAGASTRCTSTSTSTSTCNMCEYEYEYFIITWVRVRVQVLVDEYEYKYEYRSMIYILYRHQFLHCSVFDKGVLRFLKIGDKAPTAHCPSKLSLSIYICLIILCNLIKWYFN